MTTNNLPSKPNEEDQEIISLEPDEFELMNGDCDFDFDENFSPEYFEELGLELNVENNIGEFEKVEQIDEIEKVVKTKKIQIVEIKENEETETKKLEKIVDTEIKNVYVNGGTEIKKVDKIGEHETEKNAKIGEIENEKVDTSEKIKRIKNPIESQETEILLDNVEIKVKDNPLWSTIEELNSLNIPDLCSEILFSVIHSLAADEQPETELQKIINYVQQIFHSDDETFETLLSAALGKQGGAIRIPIKKKPIYILSQSVGNTMAISWEKPLDGGGSLYRDFTIPAKKVPAFVLILEVIEARALHPKDANGLSDPLCTVYINGNQKYNTSYKPETLEPVWNEHFSFPVTSVKDDFLNLEIWDYDPPESITKKIRRIKEVKSAKGFKILMKDIITTKSASKQPNQNDFMGSVKIPLNKIPSKGLQKWFPILAKAENGCSAKKKGEICLKMSLTTTKNKNIAAREYRLAYHFLLVHELLEHNVPFHLWNGQFINKFANYILHQLLWQSELTEKEMGIAKWFVLSKVQCTHAINSNQFPALIQNVFDCLKLKMITEEEEGKFWITVERLMENCVDFVSNSHKYFLNPEDDKILVAILFLLKTLGLGKDYMTKLNQDGETLNINSESKLSPEFILDTFKDVIQKGAHDLYEKSSQINEDSTEANTPIRRMIRICQLLNADLSAGFDNLQIAFKRFLGIDYFEITYRIYDEMFGAVVSPIIDDVCKDFKRLDLQEAEGDSVEDDLSMGTILFELYVAIRQFADFSSNLPSQNDLRIAGGFHNWFYASVAQWLDIAFYKGINRIKKAVELDTFLAIDKYVQRSSSAVDTAHVFHQIQVFWGQLKWPEPEGSYTFIGKILDELCRCNVMYSEIMCKKLEQLEKAKYKGDKYEISDELCSAVNNIEYLRQEMNCVAEKLGTVKILEGLTSLNGEMIGSQCKRTLETVVENADEVISDKLYALLEKVGQKIKPPIERLLKKSIESTKEEEGIGKLIKYLDDTLIKLKSRTSDGGFEKIFAIIWEATSAELHDRIQKSIDKKKQPEYFNRIHIAFVVLVNFFYPDEETAAAITKSKGIKILSDHLEIRRASTPELILKYQQERYEYQLTLPQKPGEWGIVTIRAQYCVDIRTVRIQILNARNLRATDSNGSSDPFVKVRVVPKQMYPSIPRFKTQIHKMTLFPLFDETFSMEVTSDEVAMAGLVQFLVKDHDIVGKNDFLGEAFLPLTDIPVTKSDTDLKNMPQKNLVLHNPTDFDKPVLQNLENRRKDKVAIKFIKGERCKTTPEPEE